MSKTEMIKFKLSNCPLFAKKLNVNEKLNEIRAKFRRRKRLHFERCYRKRGECLCITSKK